MSDKTEEAIQKSTDYYNSSDTDNYYRKIWGGESIHVGIFDEPGISIRDAAGVRLPTSQDGSTPWVQIRQ